MVGNHLVDGSGATVRLLGVNRSGTEFQCVRDDGIFLGPSDQASVNAIASWDVDAVRVPLNEDCWLGINGVDPAYSGSNYQSAVASFVSELNADGIIAILDLHWSAPGTELATGQEEMADADHSPAFWTSVASYFKSWPGVVYDLYNEPYGISWSCWLSGCTTSAGWQTAGMQTLVDAVRGAGADQPIMLGGLDAADDLSGWLANEPSDPDHQLIASFHTYSWESCSNVSCWDSTVAPVADSVPVVTGEMGEDDCTSGYIDSYMSWADAHGVSYLAWEWDVRASCDPDNGGTGGTLDLISSYAGDPTTYGSGLQGHLGDLAGI